MATFIRAKITALPDPNRDANPHVEHPPRAKESSKQTLAAAEPTTTGDSRSPGPHAYNRNTHPDPILLPRPNQPPKTSQIEPDTY